ncbi:MAG: acyltransferase [Candidatus Eremiobacteraeota bacterium]|nr:acyltransferase [Candidatus Eremiobacteraeota bacterium]
MTTRVPYLDGLRALAILMVVSYHTVQYQPWYAAHAVPWWTALVAQDQGVYLFFILSGFCLAYPTLSRLEQNGALKFDLARFTSRRILRIIPSYWLAIAVIGAGIALLAHFGMQPGPATAPHLTRMKIAEQVLLFNLRPQWLNGAFWTLPIEVHWYFFCPILIWVWTRSPRAFTFAALLFWFASVTTRFSAPDIQALPAFMLGIAAAHLRLRPHPMMKLAPFAFVCALCVALEPHLRHLPLHYATWEVAMFLLVVAAAEVPAIGALFSARAFAPISGASYSIYLMHSPVISTIEKYTPLSVPLALVLLCSGIFGIAAGLLFSIVAEKPFRRGAIRDAMLARLDAVLPGLFRKVGIEPFLMLAVRPRVVTPKIASAVVPNLHLRDYA